MSADKKIREQYPKLIVKDSEVSKARENISFILSGLSAFLQKQNTNDYLYDLMNNRLFLSYILDDAEYKQKIELSLNKLEAQETLTDDDLSNVDKFISILDNEASILYRKLRTTRA